jgi:hypothetical protein
MNKFEQMMNSFAETHQQQTFKPQKVYDVKNYFSTSIDKKEKEATKEIRIVVYDQEKFESTGQFWQEFYGHKIQVNGEWKTFPCLKHEEGKDCPFCEMEEALKSTGLESDKKKAFKDFSAKKMYILKVIERGNEKDGVKFWRFNHARDKSGTLDKIMGAIKAVKHDVTHPETGRDLIVNIVRNQFNTPVVQSITYPLESTKLSENPEQASQWLNDTKTWRDVYAIKTFEYLDIIVIGKTPVWSKEENKFVAKEDITETKTTTESSVDNDDAELVMGNSNPTITTSTPSSSAPQEEEDDDDDLPF